MLNELSSNLLPCHNLNVNDAFCAFCVFLQDTFTRAKNWVKELQRQASPNIVIALAGNKADVANKRAVDLQVRTIPTLCVFH